MTAHMRRFIVLSASMIVLATLGFFLAFRFGPNVRWSELLALQAQDGISSHFVRLAYLVTSIHLIAIFAMIWAYALQRRSNRPLGALWIAGFSTLVVMQILSLNLGGGTFDFALNPGTHDPEMALQYMRDRDFFL